jgi:hypothetical protein
MDAAATSLPTFVPSTDGAAADTASDGLLAEILGAAPDAGLVDGGATSRVDELVLVPNLPASPSLDELGVQVSDPGTTAPFFDFDAIVDGIVFDAGTLADVFPIAVGIGLTTTVAVSIARGFASPAVPVLATSVRLMPSMAGATIERTGVSAVEVASKLRTDVADATESAVGAIVHPLRDGFGRAVRPTADSDSLRDSRLLAQIGIVLGTIYLAFLTVWFWATRLRWNVRA